jgi:hypothetical protein
MTRNESLPVNRPEEKLHTVLVLSFERETEDQPQRTRYLACRGKETMWRVTERRCEADWQTVEVEPIEDLQLHRPEQTRDTGLNR